ncbi:hypothetical protein CVT24_006653, partial [Panaeolus cyanescens]
DSARLPPGFKRVSYDADTQQYTFKDSDGQLYKGEPGAEYGVLTPMSGSLSVEQTRPSAYATSHSRSQSLPYPPGGPPKTFQDILPPELITTSSLSQQHHNHSKIGGSNGKAREQLMNAVRKSTLPKMQNVVHNLRRSMTTMKKSSRPPIPSVHRRQGFETLNDDEIDDQESLIHHSSLRSGDLKRSDTSTTVDSDSRSNIKAEGLTNDGHERS